MDVSKCLATLADVRVWDGALPALLQHRGNGDAVPLSRDDDGSRNGFDKYEFTVESSVESSPSTPLPSSPSTPTISPPSQAPVCDYLLEMTVQVINGGQTSYELIDDTNTVVFSDSNVPPGTTAAEEQCLIEGIKYTYKITDTNVNASNYVLMLNDKLLASGGEFDNYEKVTFRV